MSSNQIIPQIPSIPAGGAQRPEANIRPANTPPTVYMIRHGEKNTPEDPGTPPDNSLIGLNGAGQKRADALPYILNNDDVNPYDIRFILVMHPESDGEQERPYQTILPLFNTLVAKKSDYCQLDKTILEGDFGPAAQRIKDYINSGSPGNVLVCWEHKTLTPILESFGFEKAPKYPGSRFDVVWELKPRSLGGHSGKTEWVYDQIKWSTEGTMADLPEINNVADWEEVTGADSNLITTAKKSGGYVVEWPPAAASTGH